MFIKGPTIQPFLKRRYHSDPESNSDEAETTKEKEKKGKKRTKLQPREIFKTESAATYRGQLRSESCACAEVLTRKDNIHSKTFYVFKKEIKRNPKYLEPISIKKKKTHENRNWSQSFNI